MLTRTYRTISKLHAPAWVVAAGLVLLSGAVALLQGQDINWDLQNYHLYNAYAFLGERYQLDLMPAGLQSFFNPWLDLLFWWGIHGPGPILTGFLLGAWQGVSLVLVWLTARTVLHAQRVSVRYALPLAVLGGLSPGFLSEIGTVYHDNTLAVLVMASLYVVIRNLDPPPFRQTSRASLLLAGVIMGVACALKPVVVIFAIGLCTALLLNGFALRSQLRAAWWFGLGVLLGMAVAGGWWWYQVWELKGNPVFPLMNHLFASPLAQPLGMQDQRFLPESLLQAVFYPLLFTFKPALVAEVEYRQLSWLLAYLLLAGFLVQRAYAWLQGRSPAHRASPETRLLLLYLLVSYIAWLLMFGIYRYVIALEILLPLVSLLLVHLLFERVSARVALAGVVLVCLYNIQAIPSWGRSAWSATSYAAELPDDVDRLSTVLLMGQPTAWLAPAFPEALPFIQIQPNFFFTRRYDQEVARRADFSGVVRVISDPLIHSRAATAGRLEQLGYSMVPGSCLVLRTQLGAKPMSFDYCEVSNTP